MYIINIKVNADLTPAQHEQLFPAHTEWFKKYFQAGKFLLLGPHRDAENSGVILAVAENRAELEQILAEDCYYPNFAQYEIREFEAKLIATNLADFIGK